MASGLKHQGLAYRVAAFASKTRRARVLFVLLLAFIYPLFLGTQARAMPLDPRTVRSETLGNGLRLVVASDPDATVVAVEIVVKVGSADDPPGQAGTAHLLEHVLWANRAGEDNDPRLLVERVGGIADAGTLRDYTRFYTAVPAGFLGLGVNALASIVLPGQLSEDVLERERQIVLEESAARAEDPYSVLNELAFAELYGADHPYGRPIWGSEAQLSRIDAARLALFHESWYVPNNMAVIICGDVSFDDAHEAVVETFGALRPAAVPGRTWPVPSRPSVPHQRIIEMPVERAYVMAAFIGPDVAEHSQVCASDLLATVLTHGPLSRLEAQLTEKSDIATDVGVDFLTQRGRALFGIRVVCPPERVDEVRRVIVSELQRAAREPVPPVELVSAKRLLAAGYAFANETPSDRATTLGFYEALDTYRIASYYLSWVTYARPETVMQVAGWYSGEPVWIVLRPKERE